LLGIEFVLRSDESMKVGVYAGGKKPREANGDDGGPLYARQILGLAPILAIDPMATNGDSVKTHDSESRYLRLARGGTSKGT
jgi:hypothetical protein